MISCPKCRKNLIERTNRNDGRKFLACPGFPNCRHTQSINRETHSPINGKRNFNPTNEQKAIIEDIINDECHVYVQAGPGCSKSTVARESLFEFLAKYPGKKTKYNCYNRNIANDFSPKCPPQTNVSTFHSTGFGILRDTFPDLGKPMVKNGEKTTAILEMMADSDATLYGLIQDDKTGPGFRSAIVSLVSQCKGHLFDGKNEEELIGLCDRFGIDGKNTFPYIPEILERSKMFKVNDQIMIDFDDMIWLCVVLDLDFGHTDLLVVDEGQDLNRVKQVFAMRLAGKGRIIFIGDKNQSINGFTGADCRSMETMQQMLQSSHRPISIRNLTITFRCPKSNVRFLNQEFPDIPLRCLETQKEGLLEEIGSDQIIDLIQPKDMILCRVNAPLIKWFFKLLKARKRAIIIGKRDEVETLISAFKALKAKTIPDALKRIEKARDKEIARLKASGKPSLTAIEATEDKFDILKEIALACKGIGEVEPVIRSMFEENVKDDRIRLSSVHRAKGAESEGVFIINPELMPHPKAESNEELQQEENVKWVAYSRSLDRLYIVH